MSNANRYLPDIELLLRPISQDAPAGRDVAYELIPIKAGQSDYLYDLVSRYRNGESGDIYNDKPKLPNWSAAYELVGESLASRSKDFQLAAWFAEALMELRGFAGFADGLKVLIGLVERYWDNGYPVIEGNDLSGRLIPFEWLFAKESGGRLPNRLLTIPLGSQPNSLTIAAWNASRIPPGKKEEEDQDTYEQRKEAWRLAGDEAAKRLPTDLLQSLHETLVECRDLCDRLGRLLVERCGNAKQKAPGYFDLRDTFQSSADVVRRILKERGAWVEEPVATEPSGEDGSQATDDKKPGRGLATGVATSHGGPIASREDALRKLEEVAAYFRRTEPHSPIPYLVQRAIAWSRMPLEKLLVELIDDQGARSRIQTLLGIHEDHGATAQSNELDS